MGHRSTIDDVLVTPLQQMHINDMHSQKKNHILTYFWGIKEKYASKYWLAYLISRFYRINVIENSLYVIDFIVFVIEEKNNNDHNKYIRTMSTDFYHQILPDLVSKLLSYEIYFQTQRTIVAFRNSRLFKN